MLKAVWPNYNKRSNAVHGILGGVAQRQSRGLISPTGVRHPSVSRGFAEGFFFSSLAGIGWFWAGFSCSRAHLRAHQEDTHHERRGLARRDAAQSSRRTMPEPNLRSTKLLPPSVERRRQPRRSPADADYFLSLIAA